MNKEYNQKEVERFIKRFLDRNGMSKDVHELETTWRRVKQHADSGKLTAQQMQEAETWDGISKLTPEQKEYKNLLISRIRLSTLSKKKENELIAQGKYQGEVEAIKRELEKGYSDDFEPLESPEDREARLEPFKKAFEEDPSVENAAKLEKERTFGNMSLEEYQAMNAARREKERERLHQKMIDDQVLEAAKDRIRKEKAKEDAEYLLEKDNSWKSDKRLQSPIKQPKALDEFEKKVDALIESGVEIDLNQKTPFERLV